MSKIDKILYGGFAVVAIGSLIALLVSVFSPLKQAVEKTIEPPKIEQPPMETASEPPQQEMDMRSYWLDEHGNKTYITEEELAASDAIEAEFKRQEEEQKALNEAEKAWWESRQDWVERFPFEATHHPEITFDPTVYQPGKGAEWPEEKKDDAYWEMKQRVENHGFLRHFYASYLPYTEEFEQMYNIIKEEIGEVDNTIALGWTFNTLKKYHQAAQQDPDAIFRENVLVKQSVPETTDSFEQEFVLGEDFFSLSEEGQQVYLAALLEPRRKAIEAQMNPPTKRRDVTWAEETILLEECILGALTCPEEGLQGITKEQAMAIRDRLINEIQSDGFVEFGDEGLRYVSSYEKKLKPGDPLLVK